MKRFAMTGISGFVARRHLQAIKDTGNILVAALDPHDSVGIIDSYFPDCNFFTEPERFDRHLEKLKRKGEGIDYLSVCSPNYLHDAHCRLSLRVGANVICEKPLVIKPWNLAQLKELEKEFDRKIYAVLQLRYHDNIRKLEIDKKNIYEVEVKYITPRGKWYETSWKYDEKKSGGILMNIGVHLFDLLIYLFGHPLEYWLYNLHPKSTHGSIKFKNANVRWLLSIDKLDLPDRSKVTPYRMFKINGEDIHLSDGFTDLHTKVYQEIIEGRGFGIDDCFESVDLVYKMTKK